MATGTNSSDKVTASTIQSTGPRSIAELTRRSARHPGVIRRAASLGSERVEVVSMPSPAIAPDHIDAERSLDIGAEGPRGHVLWVQHPHLEHRLDGLAV